MAHTLINTDGDHWRFLRNTLLPTFSSGKMRMVSVTCHKTLPVVQLQTRNVVNPLALENLRKKIFQFIAKVTLPKNSNNRLLPMIRIKDVIICFMKIHL